MKACRRRYRGVTGINEDKRKQNITRKPAGGDTGELLGLMLQEEAKHYWKASRRRYRGLTGINVDKRKQNITGKPAGGNTGELLRLMLTRESY